MAFPTTGIRDNFNRGDGSLESSTWSDTTGTWHASPWWTFSGLDILSNQAYPPVGSGGNQSNSNYGPDVEAYFTVVDADEAATRFFDVFLRWNTTGPDGYYISFTNNNTVTVIRVDDGGETQLGAVITQDTDANDSIGADMIGSTITLYFNNEGGGWASVATRSDITYTGAGKIGLFMGAGSSQKGDNFGGGTVVAAATAPSIYFGVAF